MVQRVRAWRHEPLPGHARPACRADAPTLAGLVLIGSINGGHTSNLCTLIAAA